ncbi:MAG: SPOR domain-containing protein [Capnocytophaga sp.]|nr:SPOR domain-containing protein [Capnocytophaga sp.]
MKYLLLTVSLLSTFTHVKSQTALSEFKIRYEAFINGNITIIGNNIVNRQEKRNKPNTPFDEQQLTAKVNDQLNMQYIDIDNDTNTFSSSSAYFSVAEKQNVKVVYAGLYWVATYPYASGSFNGKKYKPTDLARQNPNNVLIKIPSQENYIAVQGEAIFDNTEETSLLGIAPYVYYSDVTNLFTGVSSVGEYTIANIRATNGYIAGGVSAGWALVLVHENPESSLKKIISYDGFASVSDKEQKITFKGFKTPSEGTFQTKIIGAALEGDFNMAGDRVLLATSSNENSLALGHKTRLQRNFFNSTITDNENIITTRNPASKNTLGFDIYQLDISNENQSVIPNNAENLELTFTKSTDQYYLFLTALQIESINTNIRITKQAIEGIERGFYVIVGVYSNPNNVAKQVKKMELLGYKTHTFYNKTNNLTYIYTDKFNTYQEALTQIHKIKSEADVPDTWILRIEDSL